MSFLDTLRGTVATAVDTISTVAQTLIEKNRTNAKLSRLRAVMDVTEVKVNGEAIALGKGYYEQIKKGEKPNTEREAKLVELIDNCKAKIAKARTCYRNIVESQNEFLFNTSVENKEDDTFEQKDVVDITVACSNENEYESSPFEKAEESGKDVVEEIADELIDDESPIDELF